MTKLADRLRILSLLAAIGELSERQGGPDEGVELLDQEASIKWVLSPKHRPFASMSSLHDHGYQGGDETQMKIDLAVLIDYGYVGLTELRDAYHLTAAGLAVYNCEAEFQWDYPGRIGIPQHRVG